MESLPLKKNWAVTNHFSRVWRLQVYIVVCLEGGVVLKVNFCFPEAPGLGFQWKTRPLH